MPRDSEVNKLVVEALTPVQGGGIQWEDWVERLKPLTIEQLAQVAVGLQGGKILNARQPHALEALRTVVDAKLAQQTQDLMVQLDRATTRLQWVGIGPALVGVVMMVVQVAVALQRSTHRCPHGQTRW